MKIEGNVEEIKALLESLVHRMECASVPRKPGVPHDEEDFQAVARIRTEHLPDALKRLVKWCETEASESRVKGEDFRDDLVKSTGWFARAHAFDRFLKELDDALFVLTH